MKNKNYTSQKGITLIALIITIIVMLILVGVTINVALNGGLFTKAEDAASGTEKQSIYEQIVGNIELTNDGKISVKGTFDKVVAEFGADKVININPATVDANTTEVTFSVVGKTGTYNYKIETTGVEKDTVQASGGAQLPSQTEGLVYGKLYRGYSIEDGERIDFYMVFSKKYGICLHNWDTPNEVVAKYTYDEENKVLRVGTNFDGIDFTCGVGEICPPPELQSFELEQKITNEDISTVYKVKHFSELDLKEDLADIDLYTGIYYYSNPDTKDYDFYYIYTYYDRGYGENMIIIQNADGNFHITSIEDITILNNKQIQKDGITYTLLETLE